MKDTAIKSPEVTCFLNYTMTTVEGKKDFESVIDDALHGGQIGEDKAERLRQCIEGINEGTKTALVQVAWDLLQECVKTELNSAKARKTSKGDSPSGKSKEPPYNERMGDYIWDVRFLNYLVKKLSDEPDLYLPNSSEKNVASNITDLISEEDFPHHLTPKEKGPKDSFKMPPQGLCPPWVKEIAPFVLVQIREMEK